MKYYSNELYHHGVKGQKWGVRRYQNPDGTLTPAGKKRLTRQARSKYSVAKLSKNNSIQKKANDLRNNELRKYTMWEGELRDLRIRDAKKYGRDEYGELKGKSKDLLYVEDQYGKTHQALMTKLRKDANELVDKHLNDKIVRSKLYKDDREPVDKIRYALWKAMLDGVDWNNYERQIRIDKGDQLRASEGLSKKEIDERIDNGTFDLITKEEAYDLAGWNKEKRANYDKYNYYNDYKTRYLKEESNQNMGKIH